MTIEFFSITNDDKKILLDILGYEVDADGLIILKNTKKPHLCPITQEKVFLKEAAILPWNSSIVIKASALSISEYLSTLPEKCE